MNSKLTAFLAGSALAVAAITSHVHPHAVLAHNSITAMQAGAVGGAYSQSMQQSGGQAPYNWALAGGSKMPDGLTFDASTGIISGQPKVAGRSQFTFNVTDSSDIPLSSIQAYSMKIAPEPFSFDNVMLKRRIAGRSSTQTLVARGGTPPYFWSVSSGSLPDGVTLNSASGVLSGAAKSAKTTAFTIRVTDSAAKWETGWQRATTAKSMMRSEDVLASSAQY